MARSKPNRADGVAFARHSHGADFIRSRAFAALHGRLSPEIDDRPIGAGHDLYAILPAYSALLAAIPERLGRLVPLPLRLIVGYGFMEHGVAKLTRGLGAFPGLLHALGVPFPEFMGLLTIAVEIVGGFAVLIGALVPLAAIPMAVVLLVAIFTVHLQYGFSSIKLQAVTPEGATFGPPGYETDLLYLACLAALVLGGAGPFSVDSYLARRTARRSVAA